MPSTLNVIFGPCAAGKTTYAHALAGRERAVPFVLDEWGAGRLGAGGKGAKELPRVVGGRAPLAGFRFEFLPATPPDGRPPARGGDRRCTAAITSFAIIAVPATRHGSRYRSFCADGGNTIYVTPAGQVPRVEGARGCVIALVLERGIRGASALGPGEDLS